MMRRLFVLLLIAVTVTACTNWKEPTTITFMNGQVLKCPGGVRFELKGTMRCVGVGGRFYLFQIKSLSR